MRLGVLLPHRAVVLQSARRPPVEECWTVARRCDQAGMDVWVGDSVVAKPRLEPLTTLAYIAGITERVRLGTAVLLPALRHPVVLAHQIANLDQISGGRVIMGIGVGWSLPAAPDRQRAPEATTDGDLLMARDCDSARVGQSPPCMHCLKKPASSWPASR